MQDRHFLYKRLDLAIENNSLAGVQFDLSEISKYSLTAGLDNEIFLYSAIEHNATDVIPFLLDYLSQKAILKSILHEEEDTDSIFWHAAKHGHAEAFTRMIAIYEDSRHTTEEGNHVDVPWEMPDENGNTPLHIACQHGNLDIVKIIVEAAEDEKNNTGKGKGKEKEKETTPQRNKIIKMLNAYNHAGQTPLHLAMQTKNLPLVDYLIGQGAQINVEDGDSKRPLQLFSNELGSLLQLEKLRLDEKISHMERELQDHPENEDFLQNYFQLASRHSLQQLTLAHLKYDPAVKQKRRNYNYYDGMFLPPDDKNPLYKLSKKRRYLPVPEHILALISGIPDIAFSLGQFQGSEEDLAEIQSDDELAEAERGHLSQDIKKLNRMSKEIKKHIEDLRMRENPLSVNRITFDYASLGVLIFIYLSVLACAITLSVIYVKEEHEEKESCFKAHNTTENDAAFNNKDLFHTCDNSKGAMAIFPIGFGIFGVGGLIGSGAYLVLRDKSKSIYRHEWEDLEYNVDLFIKALKLLDEKENEAFTIKQKYIKNLEKISSQLKSSSIQLNKLVTLLGDLDNLISELKSAIIKKGQPVISLLFLPVKPPMQPQLQKATIEELSEGEGSDEGDENSTLLTPISDKQP